MAENKPEPKVSLRTSKGIQTQQVTKFAAIGGALVVFVIIAVAMSRPAQEPVPVIEPRIDISNEGIGEKSWAIRAQSEVRDATQRVRDLQQAQDNLGRAFNEEKEQRARMQKQLEDIQTLLKNGLPQQPTQATPPATSTGPAQTPPNTIIGQAPETPQGDGRVPPPPPRPWIEGETEQVYREAARIPGQASAPAQTKRTMVVSGITDEEMKAGQQEEVTAATNYVENRYAGFIPAGTFAEGALLTGVDAGASEQTRANPQPVLIRLQTDGTTAGDGSYSLQTCFLIGQAYGDLSSERAYVTIAKLSCVDPRHSRILEAPLTAYVVDSDGTIGLRGKLIERNGQLIAKSILTGVFSGLGQVAAQVNQANAQQVVANGLTGVTQQSSVNIDAGALAAAAGFQGVANASNNLSQFFLKQAESIFPVIFVPAGRKVTVVTQEGTALKWEDYAAKFTKVVTPQGG